jgi:hypothetical protein
MTRNRSADTAAIVAVLAIVAAFWWQGERFIAANGPTFDEGVHLAAGYSYWVTGDFRLNREDPPVMKLLWGLPLILGERPPYPHDVAAATKNDLWSVGAAFVYGSGVSPARLLNPARRVNLVFGGGAVLLAGWWAYRLWGRAAGLAAAAFAAADPNLLALSCVLSTDAGFTFFALLSGYLLWEYAARPCRGLLYLTGASLGLMLGSKLSALGMIAGFGAAGALFALRGGVLALPGTPEPAGGWARGARLRSAAELAFRLGVIGAVALAATYGFVEFHHFGAGLQFQLTRKSFGNEMFYLCGELSKAGWYHYFLVLLLLKLPLGLLVAGAAALLAWVGTRQAGGVSPQLDDSNRGLTPPARQEDRTLFLWVPPLVFFAAASYSRVDLGIRVVLPAIAFLYVFAARLATPGCCRPLRLALLGGCVAWTAAAAWNAAPHQLAYFNELAGGREGGLRYAADSNLDWGQDLPLLKAYMDREGLEIIYLSYFGTDRPEAHGIRYHYLPGYGRADPTLEEVPADAPRHVVAVSANNLIGTYLKNPDTFAWLRDRRPAAILGGSIYVFDLTGDPEAVTRVRGMTPQ